MDDNESTWSYSPETSTGTSSNAENVSWSASEYIQHDKTATWYALVISGTLVLSFIAYLINHKDIVTGVTLLVVAFSALFFASRKPASKNYELGNGLLKVDGKKYDLRNFKSFSLVEEGAINSIWLKPLGKVTPMIVIYFAPEDENKIASALGEYLPYEFRQLDPLDKLMRRLRF